jgi:hypothetical protein
MSVQGFGSSVGLSIFWASAPTENRARVVRTSKIFFIKFSTKEKRRELFDARNEKKFLDDD